MGIKKKKPTQKTQATKKTTINTEKYSELRRKTNLGFLPLCV